MELSIVIPVYNVASYIRRCLHSIYSQNVSEEKFEVIIVDDETPDNSIEIALCYLSGKANYRIIHQKNRGLGGARNTGLRYAIGRYIWFVDSDDEIVAGTLENILNLVSESRAEIVNYKYIKNNSHLFNNIPSCTALESSGIELILKGKMLTTVWNNIYKKEYLIENSLFFKEKFKHEDSEFNMRACSKAKKIAVIDLPIYNYYTTNSGSIMNNIGLQNQIDLMGYLSTADSLMKTEIITIPGAYDAISRYIGLSLAMLFSQSEYLTTKDYTSFIRKLKKNRSRYLEYIHRLPWKSQLVLLMQLYFPLSISYIQNIIRKRAHK